jgi:hypothetical protein
LCCASHIVVRIPVGIVNSGNEHDPIIPPKVQRAQQRASLFATRPSLCEPTY